MAENTPKTGWVQTVSVSPPTLSNNTADADRLIEALKTGVGTRDIFIDLEPAQIPAGTAPVVQAPRPLRAFQGPGRVLS